MARLRDALTVALTAGAAVLTGAAAQTGGQSRPAMADLSAPVSIRGECSFGPALDRAVRNMIAYEGDPPVARAGRVSLGGRRLTPRLASAPDAARPGFRSQEATVSLRPAARWHGLSLTGLRERAGWEWRAYSLEFAEGPARLRAALLAMGIALPLPPGRRHIPVDECSAAIAIEARGQGSALTCSSGC